MHSFKANSVSAPLTRPVAQHTQIRTHPIDNNDFKPKAESLILEDDMIKDIKFY